MSDIIVLNIGGTKFITYRATLQHKPNTLLGKLFSPNNKEEFKPNFSDSIHIRQYFFDRDPTFFNYILNYYRGSELRRLEEREIMIPGGKLVCPGELKAFNDELEYWQVPDKLSQK